MFLALFENLNTKNKQKIINLQIFDHLRLRNYLVTSLAIFVECRQHPVLWCLFSILLYFSCEMLGWIKYFLWFRCATSQIPLTLIWVETNATFRGVFQCPQKGVVDQFGSKPLPQFLKKPKMHGMTYT